MVSSAAAIPVASAASPPSAERGARLMWLRDGRLAAAAGTAGDAQTPLGSVWKLFVYGYLQETGAAEPAYRCSRSERRDDDEYCCDPGESLDRDAALARSCGAYFDPARLGIVADDWRRFWQAHASPEWLFTLSAMQPATTLPVARLLDGLRRMPDSARLAAREALLPNTLRDEGVVSVLGGGPRFKTWSWHRVGAQAEREGGAAGWLADGTPFWFGAAGTSRSAMASGAAWIAAQWRAAGFDAAATRPDAAAVAAEPCVDVRMFARYPLRAVVGADGAPAANGPLRGRHRLAFENGSSLAIVATPSLRLSHEGAAPVISARLPLEDYVARVVDREGDAGETSAARALAVAARSWLWQNAAEQAGCRATVDDSRAQRVGPNPPSAAARAAAAFTEGLVLRGSEVRYRLEGKGEGAAAGGAGVMAWRQAVAASRAGRPFDAILRTAFPGAALAGLGAASDCEPLPEAAQWLAARERRWHELLRESPGFEPTAAALQVCRLAFGAPSSDQRRLRIRVREWQSRDGRVSLLHEYLHLAFRHHPNGVDEAFVERLAQRLADA